MKVPVLPIIILLAVLSVSLVHAGNELVIGKPFGPSVAVPDPGKGYNGWYTSEAGITETLFVLDFDMTLKPWLAKSHRQIDPRTWEIELRKGIRFQDHSPLNAGAVKWSFDRVIGKAGEAFNERIQALLDIESIAVRDENTLIFKTNKPNAAFLYDLTSPGTGIISPSGQKDRFFGTGPFSLAKVVPNREMIVRGFDGYWGGKPNLSRVWLKTIKNPATRMLAFEAGELDVAVNFPEHDAKRIQNRSGVKIYGKACNRLCFFFVRVADGPLADIRVRKALNYAIDRREIVDAVLAGMGGEAGVSVFPEILPWSNRNLEPYLHDPGMASRFLADAGAVDTDGDGMLELNGRPLELNMWTYEGRASLKPTLELVQAQLRSVGIATRLKVTQKGSPINIAMTKGEVHLNMQMWNAAPQGDPDYFISNVFTRNADSNFMGYSNPELDALARKGKITFDEKERKKIYDRIQAIIHEDSPVIVLFHKSMVSAAHDYVENYRIHPAEKYILTDRLGRR